VYEVKVNRTECIVFTNIMTSRIADICKPAGYRLAAVVAKCIHGITWMSSEKRNHCNS